jgi:putative FmdB family regulatory protein
MPIREYLCTKCGARKERIELAERGNAECGCGYEMQRLFPTGTGFQLRGDGWPGKEIKKSS